MLSLILLVLAVIIFSGLFSGTEAAILSVTPSEVEAMLHKKRPGAPLLHRVTQYLNRSVTAILIMNNIVNIAGSIMVGQLVVQLYGSAVLGIITTAFTFGIIIFSEIIPKSIATRYARTVSITTAPMIFILSIVFLPIIYPIEYMMKKLVKGERTIGTEAQIRSLVRIGRRSGHIEQDEGQLIHRVFHLNDLTAQDLMIPRDKIVALPATMNIHDAAEKMIDDPHSRFPVYGDNLDDIEGIVLEREILALHHSAKATHMLKEYLRPALMVDSDTKADDLLILFRDELTHMAIVREKGKKTVGVITLEDVLEELVGEIEDERDFSRKTEERKRSMNT